MQSKKIYYQILCAILVLLSPGTQALQFSFDNYAGAQTLSYSYSFDQKNWTWAGFLPGTKDSPQGYITADFGGTIPLSWKIEAGNRKSVHCIDYYSQQPTTNIVTLKNLTFATKENLLLDVIEDGGGGFVASIIDTDGEDFYSNIVSCKFDR
jgi:hypothetical protein